MALNMTIPVPKDESLVESFLSPINAINSLNQNMLNQRMQELQNYYYGPQSQSQIDYRDAQTNKLNQLTPLQEKELQLKNKFYPALTQAQIKNENALAKFREMGGGRAGAGLTDLNATMNEIKRLNPNLNDQEYDEANKVYALGGNKLSNGKELSPQSYRLQQLFNQTYKRGTDVGQRNQERFANTLEDLFVVADKNAPDAFQFAGVLGKTNNNIEAAKAQFDKNSKAYENYNKFVDQDIPTIVSEIVRTSGANSTDAQKALALKAALPINMRNNPKIAQAQWEELKKLYRTVSKSISGGPANIHASLINKTSNEKRRVYNPQTGMLE